MKVSSDSRTWMPSLSRDDSRANGKRPPYLYRKAAVRDASLWRTYSHFLCDMSEFFEFLFSFVKSIKSIISDVLTISGTKPSHSLRNHIGDMENYKIYALVPFWGLLRLAPSLQKLPKLTLTSDGQRISHYQSNYFGYRLGSLFSSRTTVVTLVCACGLIRCLCGFMHLEKLLRVRGHDSQALMQACK